MHLSMQEWVLTILSTKIGKNQCYAHIHSLFLTFRKNLKIKKWNRLSLKIKVYRFYLKQINNPSIWILKIVYLINQDLWLKELLYQKTYQDRANLINLSHITIETRNHLMKCLNRSLIAQEVEHLQFFKRKI